MLLYCIICNQLLIIHDLNLSGIILNDRRRCNRISFVLFMQFQSSVLLCVLSINTLLLICFAAEDSVLPDRCNPYKGLQQLTSSGPLPQIDYTLSTTPDQIMLKTDSESTQQTTDKKMDLGMVPLQKTYRDMLVLYALSKFPLICHNVMKLVGRSNIYTKKIICSIVSNYKINNTKLNNKTASLRSDRSDEG